MSLFQNNVVKKYTNTLNKKMLDEKWQLFTTIFHNTTKQNNIRNSKEEQYQAIFLNDLFVQVFGYTQHPNNNYNLITEQKNETNSKKADGAIILNENVHAVIELKGTETTDLSKIENQAFGYKNNQKNCSYVIISNFEKLRFYIDNATEHIEFNLFTLNRGEFDLLYTCLSLESMQTDLPKKIKNESVSSEDKITKELYKDYSTFRKELFSNIEQLNPQYDRLLLFKKTQKLLDRFLFIFFAEDRQLLPTNLIFSINLEWQKLREARVLVSLYDRYKMYFQDLNTGARVSLPAFGKHTNEIVTAQYDIYAYNGGLFQPDNVLDTIAINDDLLFKHTKKLSEYDFESEVDVNILGHIFENSLNEIDEVRNQLSKANEIDITNNPMGHDPLEKTTIEIESASTPMDHDPLKKTTIEIESASTPMGHDSLKKTTIELDNAITPMDHDPLKKTTIELDNAITPMGHDPLKKQISKRKKDGVFYTPKYITKYIVDNTIGKLCEEKKIAIKLDETKYTTDKKITVATKKELIETLDSYRKWLLQLTIVDPACGSGAFLNQALDFLIAEHKYVDELQAKLFGDALVLSDVEGSILENNLFGVDLNEESVEIAKLSLWLRTAQRNRKLNSLNNNIKCGNSLIDDASIAGDKAFKWHNEFPKVFKEKNKHAFHLVFTTHNSRVSQRMIDYKVKKGPAIELNLEEEIELTKIFKQIINENSYNCLAYNICKDHVHLILVCEENELTSIVQKIKSISSKLFHRLEISRGHDPLEHKNHLWSQKFFFAQLDDLVWADISPKPGYIATDTYLENAINYIKNNRNKHNLPDSKELKTIINSFVVPLETAFKTEYAGGFDVVIGNPPYVQIQSMGTISCDLEKQNFETFEKTGDLYCLFYELGNIILKQNGLLGFITSNKWLRANYGKSLRNYLIKNTQPIELLDLGSGIFESATVDSNILIFEKTKINQKAFIGLDISKEKTFTDFKSYESYKVEITLKLNEIWTISNQLELQIKNKIESIGTPLKDWNIKINYGIKTGFNEAFIIDENTKNELIQKDAKNSEIIVPILRGRDINRYYSDFQNLYLINTHNGYKNNPRIEVENHPTIKEHLDKFYSHLEKRGDKGVTPYNLRNCAYVDDFYKSNIFYPDICQKLSFSFVNGYFTNNTGYYLNTDNKFILTILNSNLINIYYKTISAQLGETGIRCFTIYIENIPIKKISFESQQPFIEKADLMLALSKELQLLAQKFSKYFSGQFKIEKLSGKLEKWYDVTFEEFIKEINKAIKTQKGTPLTKKDEFDWIDLFEENKAKANALQNQIATTDKAIDAMVYELYGLSEDEIKIVENS